MKVRIECPYCDGIAVLQRQQRELVYRKEQFKVVEYFYKCEKCSEEFTTTETDTVTLLQAHNQYREKHGILFPEEIVEIKEKYELSAAKMSEVLGLGINGYSNYENGEIPNAAIANLIKTVSNPEVFLELLEKSKHIFSKSLFDKTRSRVCSLISEVKKSKPFYTALNIYHEANKYTGYRSLNFEKITNLVIFFIKESKQVYNNKLKINKQLFYTDFLHYKNYGKSITGLSYRAINYGPVPANYDNIFTYLENEKVIFSNWIKTGSGSAIEIFTTEGGFESVAFSKEELTTIDSIMLRFKDMSSWDIVDLSHEERAWKELEAERKLISYQEYAFDLIGV